MLWTLFPDNNDFLIILSFSFDNNEFLRIGYRLCFLIIMT